MGSIFSLHRSQTKQKDEKNSCLCRDSNLGLLGGKQECYLCAVQPLFSSFLRTNSLRDPIKDGLCFIVMEKTERKEGDKEKAQRTAGIESLTSRSRGEGSTAVIQLRPKVEKTCSHIYLLTTMSWVRIPVSNNFCRINLFHVVSALKKNLTLLLCWANLL